MGWFILLVIFLGIAIYITDVKNTEFKKEHGYSHTSSFEYCGGNDQVIKKCNVNLYWSERENHLILEYGTSGSILTEVIPYDDILKISGKTETQIRNDVTLTRLAVLGIFAFGAKKETKTTTNYLVIKYLNYDKEEQNLILGGVRQYELDAYIKIIKDYRSAKEKFELDQIEAELLELEKEENNI